MRIVRHGAEAEVVVRAGGREGLDSVVAGAVAGRGLQPGCPIQMIIKARSCHVLRR